MDSLRTRHRNTYYFILLAGLLAIIWAAYRMTAVSPTEKPLSDLLTALDSKAVVSGTFQADADRVDWVDTSGHSYRTVFTAAYATVLIDRFHQQGLSVVVRPPLGTPWLVIVPNALLFIMIGGAMWYVLRRSRRLRVTDQAS